MLLGMFPGKTVFAEGYFTFLGSKSFSAEQVLNPSLVIDSSGTPYVAYEGYMSDNVTVMKYTGMGITGWEVVGNTSLPVGRGNYPSLAIDSSGTLYVSYMDYNNGSKATVMKYSGYGATGWEPVGSTGFSAGKVHKPSLAIDSSGVLYVAYEDQEYGLRATVMKFNGVSWEAVGSAAFSAGRASYQSLCIDNSGIPYLAYRDWGNGHKATVMKYSGKGIYGWEPVGSVAFSAGQADYTSLKINSIGVPYVAYMDGYYGDKATVMKYNGANWEAVGVSGFSGSSASDPSLAINSSDIPYVAYQDWGNGGKTTVKKYMGTNWETVGTPGISDGNAFNHSLAIDRNSIPYVAFTDGYTKANVMKLTNEGPIDAETPTITTQPADVTVNVGGTVTLSLTATVTKGNLSYQWYNNTSNTNSGGMLINGATGSNFSPPTMKAEIYYYYCKVTNTDNTATGNKTKTINSNSVAVNVQANKYTVTFDSKSGSSVGSITTDYNSLITAPTSPTKIGYTFSGWYKEAECITPWNFITDKVISDTTIYAKWRIVDYRDINQDGVIDILDIALLARHYNDKIGQPNWDIIYDLNNDAVVDIYDFILVSKSINTN